MIKELSDICSSGNRLSVSIDEWTSIRNKRYFSVICHTTKTTHYNLGLVYIPGKCGAIEVRQIVEERLKHFGVKFETDIVAVTSDGPSVMKKFGRESPCEMVLCVNHAIHLAILDTFCKKQSEVTAARNALHNNDEHSSSDETSSTDNDDESYISNEEPKPQIIDDINYVMTETRSIIRFFRKSPLKSITLQKHVVAEFGVELVLLLDVRTRWNSMLTMIERILKLKNAIKKALIDLDSSQKWNEDNITVLQKLQMILTPTKLAVEALSRQDANLLTAEAIID
ncbi:jg14831, partial [Pararge aegeria aegeria]